MATQNQSEKMLFSYPHGFATADRKLFLRIIMHVPRKLESALFDEPARLALAFEDTGCDNDIECRKFFVF